ncbi:winged helix-turn-helix transcriptional regulator [Staphylococcus durrellii]|uniref:winged helix-turn-helix transcriptional regulator n=1 Tax=Staphylococcus durrellii TaxID=2781773 RepID=UPI00189EDE77|nr:helix-turn-helix domain-containing protein [Staphylococcus durrellii]MBF7016000.1 helix-turn-helix transcriptional regulator [Staphylococcus durrellii]
MIYGNCNEVIERGCPVERVLNSLGGKWKGIILSALYEKPNYYNALHREISGISRKMLTEQLSDLIKLQVVSRDETTDYPKKVRYSLTQRGRALYPLIQNISQLLKTENN